MNAEDETSITDIELLPDGRIYVFGTSLEVLEVLDELQQGRDEKVKRRLSSGLVGNEEECQPRAILQQGDT